MLTYNREDMISNMINDILNQSYLDYEFVIVDNGSTDKSGDIAEKYSRLDTRITVIHTGERKSIGAGRNIGFRASHGEYITFVDDDDRVEMDFLEFLYQEIKGANGDISMCGSDEWINDEVRPHCIFEQRYILSNEEAVMELVNRRHIRAGMGTKLFRRELIEKDPFVENALSEDIHTIYKYLSESRTVVLHGISKYHHVIHGTNNSCFTDNFSRMTPEMLREYIDVYHERATYLANKFPRNTEFWEYSVWSFLISMCTKIQKFRINILDKEYTDMLTELNSHKLGIYQNKYITEDEIINLNVLVSK